MSWFFAESGWVALFTCAVFFVGSSRAESPHDLDRATRAELRAVLASAPLLEVGKTEEMASARDRQSAIAREALLHLRACSEGDSSAVPDQAAMDWIGICTSGFAGALRQEAVRLDRSGQEDGVFRSIWTEMTRAHLDVLDRWPRLRRGTAGSSSGHADSTAGALAEQLILLCSPETYEGESFALPRTTLFARMATLPESLFQCCVDPERCMAQQGAPCLDRLTADIARQTDLDALVGYRNGSRYWSFPWDAPPRGRANDAAVARAQGSAALEMLRACSETQMASFAPGAVMSPAAARRALREAGMLWPPDADPFVTVPGLRSPRTGSDGRLVCDLALWGGCIEALPPTLRARLEARLAPDARILPVDAPGGRR